MNKINNLIKKIKDAIYSKKGLAITAILSFIYISSMIVLLIISTIIYNNPSISCGSEFKNLRKSILEENKESNDPIMNSSLYGKKFYYSTTSLGEKKYNVFVSSDVKTSNYFGIMTHKKYQDYSINIKIINASVLDAAYISNNNNIFAITIVVLKADGTPYTFLDTDYPLLLNLKYSCNTKLEYHFLDNYLETTNNVLSREIIDDIIANSDDNIKEFVSEIPLVLKKYNINNHEKFFNKLKNGMESVNVSTRLLFICAGLSLFGGTIISFFLLSLINTIKLRKKNKLIEAGINLDKYNEDRQEHLKDYKKDPFDTFVMKTHYKPIFGEWFIRALGFILIVVGSIFMKLINKNIISDTGQLYKLFNNFSTIGYFLLVIALVGIIAQTNKKLTRGSIIFFILSVTYYFTINSIFFALDNVSKSDYDGLSISNMIASMLPGNIFLSIGLFTFIGFFLFEEPDEWFIKRKVFRGLSAIPTSIAIISVALSILWSNNVLQTNYWIKSFLFIRNFDGLVVGILFEYALFAFKSIYTKRYGKNVAENDLFLPHNQLKKNLALCAIVIIYIILFYIMPYDWKKSLVDDSHTYVYLLIPIFLFYKPIGKDYKPISNFIYYAIYIAALIIPSIINIF